MRARVCFCLVTVLVCLMSATASVAQQGHPLSGIWLGDWGPTPDERNPIVLEMIWENTTLRGNINPGFPDGATIEVGELDSSNWTVHLEAMSADEDGNPVRVVVDGQLADLGSPNRTISGTWTRGDVTGDFAVTRD